MGSKTRVVVTSKLEHLKRSDKILMLHNGECYFYGTFSELQAQRPDFSSLLLGLEAYDNIVAERRSSILTETLRRVSVDETAGFRGPEALRQSFQHAPPQSHNGVDGYPEKRKQSLILNPIAAARKISFIGNSQQTGTLQPSLMEEGGNELSDRRFSVVPEDDQVEEALPRSNLYHHGLQHLGGQRRQSVLAFITNAQGQDRRERMQSSFRKKLSVTPQYDLATELDIYARRLSKDSVFEITEEVEEEDMEVCPIHRLFFMCYQMQTNVLQSTSGYKCLFCFPQQCFADERENVFVTTSWSTYLRYVSTNKTLIYVLIFIAIVFAIEVRFKPFSSPCF